MANELNVDVNAFWENGYQIIRNAYTRDEIQRIREAALASRGRGPGDLLSNPKMRNVLTDGRFVSVAKQLLGSDDIWYSGDSSFTINSSQRGFHKDNVDRKDPKGPDWKGRYTLLRFGIYLQDHYSHTGGLNLRAKSHNTTDHNYGKNIYVRTRPGDLAVWSMRTTHSGNGALYKFPKWVFPEPKDVPNLPKWRVAKADGDRVAVFAALGLDDAHHHRYVEYMKTRTYLINSFKASVYDEETRQEAKNAGLNIWDVAAEIEGDDTVGKNVAWEPIPYEIGAEKRVRA
ncbi:hypothetical protein Aab01nite_62270 [Paractinoplanes abujensis]|uniref:Uncharacterized protein n=1 Tax=Paractinoplanes abujensis TaxID=882441 RepID=A0A7W7CQM3_9ACTN|nr:hypothetical protein [Actinoplanes abujensis]MBB4692863.1 hypothetical protein [Actinoplanes abujensis]GID22637.1 hypothetical protein Aab01nite_62270 [Actinoplanes abujensis]